MQGLIKGLGNVLIKDLNLGSNVTYYQQKMETGNFLGKFQKMGHSLDNLVVVQ